MNKLSTFERSQIIRCLVDGNSIRATERITGITKKAITRLLVDMGETCRRNGRTLGAEGIDHKGFMIQKTPLPNHALYEKIIDS